MVSKKCICCRCVKWEDFFSVEEGFEIFCLSCFEKSKTVSFKTLFNYFILTKEEKLKLNELQLKIEIKKEEVRLRIHEEKLKLKEERLKLKELKRKNSTSKEYRRTYQQKRIDTDPQFKIKQTLRSRVYSAIIQQGGDKAFKTMELLGCSIEHLIKHLESQFDERMNWDNHGLKGWHIDHIIPCRDFDLTNPEEQKKCFHYTNQQPLWWWDNLAKNRRKT
jgi:hypothetical protein